MQESPAAAAPLQLVAPVPVANVGPQSRLSPAVQQQQEQPQTQLHYSPPQQLKPSVPVQDGNFAVPAPNRARVSIGGLVVELNAKQLEDRSRELQALAAMLQRLHHRTPGVAEIGPG